jgi:hypothetical protein
MGNYINRRNRPSEELLQVGISAADPDPHGSALSLVSWIRIRIGNADPDLGRRKWPTKKEKRLIAGCSLLRAGGFSCGLGVLLGDLGINTVAEFKYNY